MIVTVMIVSMIVPGAPAHILRWIGRWRVKSEMGHVRAPVVLRISYEAGVGDVRGKRRWIHEVDNVGTTTYNAADQMTAAGGVAYGYDNNGNQTSRGGDSFTYDHENRLAQSVIGGVTSSSTYNGDGLRMSHTVSGNTTNYTWDVGSSLPEILKDDNYTYVYGLDLISATDAGGNQRYYMHDGIGSVSMIAEQGGGLRAEYYYSEFGLPAFTWEFDASPNDRRFTGEQQDGDSGLYYLRARYYDPSTGPLLGRDPAGAGHPYSYARNNPVRFVDPYGLDACETISGLFGKKKTCKEVRDDVIDAGEDLYANVISPATQIGDIVGQFTGNAPGFRTVSGFLGAISATIDIWTSCLSLGEKIALSGLNAVNLAIDFSAGTNPAWIIPSVAAEAAIDGFTTHYITDKCGNIAIVYARVGQGLDYSDGPKE